MKRLLLLTFLAVQALLFSCSEDDTTDPTPQVPTRGLVAYYPLDGSGSDAGPNGYNAVAYGSTVTAPDREGRSGKSIRFDGVSQYMAFTPSQGSKFEFANAMTISFWVYGYDGDEPTCCGNIVSMFAPFSDGWAVKWYHANDDMLQIQLVHDAVPSQFRTPMDSLRYPNNALKGAWHHVAYTYSSADNTIRMWLDGILTATKGNCMYSFTHSGNEVFIGGANLRDANGNYTISGSPIALDDLRFYNVVLDENEILQLKNEKH